MATQRYIHCVGTTDEDTAHVRLLLRLAKTRVRDSWAWGPEAKADLVIADTRKVVGETALRRAEQRGVVGVRIIGPNDPTPGGQFLRRPLQREPFASLLARIEDGSGAESSSTSWDDGFDDLDLGQIDLSALEAEHPGAHKGYGPGVHAGEKRPDLEPAGVGDLSAHLAGIPVPGTESAGDRSARNGASPAATPRQTPNEAEASAPPVEEVLPELAIDPDAKFPLVYYLEKAVLRGPARIVLPHRLPLVIDPETQMFWSQDLLPKIEPYAQSPLRYGDWERLDRTGFQKATNGIAARPFIRLVWMDAFVHSNGFLSKRWNAGGDFRLTNRIDFTLDYPHAVRVGACMVMPRKLHEISRVSSVPLEKVFDIINAYDALGYVEGTQR